MRESKVKYFCFLAFSFVISQFTFYLLSTLFSKSIEANSRAIEHVVPVSAFYKNAARIIEISWIGPLLFLVAGFLLSRKVIKNTENLAYFAFSACITYCFFSFLILFLSAYIWTRYWVQH